MIDRFPSGTRAGGCASSRTCRAASRPSPSALQRSEPPKVVSRGGDPAETRAGADTVANSEDELLAQRALRARRRRPPPAGGRPPVPVLRAAQAMSEYQRDSRYPDTSTRRNRHTWPNRVARAGPEGGIGNASHPQQRPRSSAERCAELPNRALTRAGLRPGTSEASIVWPFCQGRSRAPQDLLDLIPLAGAPQVDRLGGTGLGPAGLAHRDALGVGDRRALRPRRRTPACRVRASPARPSPAGSRRGPRPDSTATAAPDRPRGRRSRSRARPRPGSPGGPGRYIDEPVASATCLPSALVSSAAATPASGPGAGRAPAPSGRCRRGRPAAGS